MRDLEIRKVVVPVVRAEDREMLAEACVLWRDCFGAELEAELKPQLTGGEVAYNEDAVYLGLEDGRVVTTCHLTRSRMLPWAGIGEVATVPDCRGRGLAQAVVGAALDEFDGQGGEAVWLGTVNPSAASVYARLGFGFLPDTSVMQRLRSGLSPVSFARKWNDVADARVVAGSPAFRIPMIPLLTAKLGVETLDEVVGIRGTEFTPQHSCMGLYPKYDVLKGAVGGWSALVNGRGVVLGLASWRPLPDGMRRIGGFVHPAAAEWKDLLLGAVAR